MAKFFVPFAEDEEQTSKIYEAVKTLAKMTMGGTTDRKIFRIDYIHGGKSLYAEVDKPEPTIKEPVVAILEGLCYLVCTPSRGFLRGIPILVGGDEILRIQDFE